MDETNTAAAGDSQATTAPDLAAPAGQAEQATPPAAPELTALQLAMLEADGHPQVVQCVRDALHLLAEKIHVLSPAA
jgi:hypothetical protein